MREKIKLLRHTYLLRQLHLMRRLQTGRGRALPFDELRRYLLHATSVGDFEGGYTLRTFQRDKQELIDLFGITIRHCRGQGYYLAETEPLLAEHERLLKAVAVELQEFLRLPVALGQHVQPETRRPLARAGYYGVERLAGVFWARAH